VLFETESACFGRVYGVDVELEAARLLVAHHGHRNVHLLHPVNARKEIENHSLDVVVAAEVLEHISELEETLQFIHEKIARNGKFLVTLPTESALYRFGRWLAGFKAHFHLSNAAAIDRKILRYGFRLAGMKKIPLGYPMDIYWLVSYDPP
jgi:2-polyprenyl-3-methyl-5-hydroxy-6-metoxy-1,4-benzoquinol methylase